MNFENHSKLFKMSDELKTEMRKKSNRPEKNSSMIQTIEELQKYITSVSERVGEIEEALEEAESELPSISRQNSRLSVTSFNPPDMTPFLKDIEKLQDDICEMANKIEVTFVTKDLFDLFVSEYKLTTDQESFQSYSSSQSSVDAMVTTCPCPRPCHVF